MRLKISVKTYKNSPKNTKLFSIVVAIIVKGFSVISKIFFVIIWKNVAIYSL